jgi:hypothetical protein
LPEQRFFNPLPDPDLLPISFSSEALAAAAIARAESRRGDEDRELDVDLDDKDLVRPPPTPGDVLEPGRFNFFSLAVEGRLRLLLDGTTPPATSDEEPADAWRTSLLGVLCEFLEVKIFRGILDNERGVSGLFGDLLADILSCLIVDFLILDKLLRSLLRIGEAFTADLVDNLMAASASAFLMYVRIQERTPFKFLQGEQVILVHGFDSVRSRIDMARPLPVSS